MAGTINGHHLIDFNRYPDREPAFRTLGPDGVAHCRDCTASGTNISLTQCPASDRDHGLLTWPHLRYDKES